MQGLNENKLHILYYNIPQNAQHRKFDTEKDKLLVKILMHNHY